MVSYSLRRVLKPAYQLLMIIINHVGKTIAMIPTINSSNTYMNYKLSHVT